MAYDTSARTDDGGGKALADVRRLLLDPVRCAKQEAGKYVQSVGKDRRFAPQGLPEPDIMLVTEPHGCWIVRVPEEMLPLGLSPLKVMALTVLTS